MVRCKAVRVLGALALTVACAGSTTAQTCGDGAKTGGEACDDGNTVGGDGCAANCTLERDVSCTLAQGSQSLVQAAFFMIPTALQGQIVLTVGAPRADAPAQAVPFVIRAADAYLAPSNIPGIGTSCTSVGEIPGWGPGNAGGGLIDCGTTRLDGIDVSTTIDSAAANPTPVVEHSGMGAAGSVSFEIGLTNYTLLPNVPFCVAQPGSGPPEFGADAQPCTGDDPARPPASAYPGTSGTAIARVLNASDGTDTLESMGSGRPIGCAQLDGATVLSGATLVAAFPALDRPQLGDVGIVVTLVCEPTTVVATPTARIIQTCVPTPTPTPTLGAGGTATTTATAPPTATATVAVTLPPATTTASAAPPTATATSGVLPTATATSVLPPTATATNSSPATPTATTAAGACVGDCNGDRTVAIDELIRAVNIALGSTALAQCPSIDVNGDAAAGIEELIRAVNNALQGCPS